MLAKFLKSALLGLCILIALLVTLYAISARWPIPDAQRQALAQIDQPPAAPPAGSNLFAALWLLPYAVPATEQDVVMARDLQRFANTRTAAGFVSDAARYPRTPPWPVAAPPKCNWSTPDCLDKVRAQPQAYADALMSQAPLLQRAATLSSRDYYRNLFPTRADTPLPELQGLSVPMTQHALDFVQGHQQAALSGVCADAQVARVLLRGQDTLIATMIGAAMLRGNAELFTDMLSELPSAQPLPAHCQAAFAPLTMDETSLCRGLRGEARLVSANYRAVVEAGGEQRRWYDRLVPPLLDVERTRALTAPYYTWACHTDVRTQLEQDRKVATSAIPAAPTVTFACIANAIGCLFVDVEHMDSAQYQWQLQDLAATTRLTSAVLWLRAHPAEQQTLAQRLDQLPATLIRPGRDITAVKDGKTLELPRYARSDHANLQMPLAASKVAQAAAMQGKP